MARKKLDFYETNLGQVRALLARTSINPCSIVLEPCAGLLAISDPIKDANNVVITNDVNQELKGLDFYLDAKSNILYESVKAKYGSIDWVITNPPFSEAYHIARTALPYVSYGMILLLRLTWLEPTLERGAWLITNPPTRLLVFGSPRPSYTGKGTDSATTAWFIWSKHVAPGIEFITNWTQK